MTEVEIDPQGNVPIGYMGTGDKIIGFDARIDTVVSAIWKTGLLSI